MKHHQAGDLLKGQRMKNSLVKSSSRLEKSTMDDFGYGLTLFPMAFLGGKLKVST